jgi:hypothetical protein
MNYSIYLLGSLVPSRGHRMNRGPLRKGHVRNREFRHCVFDFERDGAASRIPEICESDVRHLGVRSNSRAIVARLPRSFAICAGSQASRRVQTRKM